MALQAYADANASTLAVYKAPELDPAEIERRQKEAEELEKKLKFINEKIPHRVMNIMGSNAGAGSGTFHEYRLAKRREQQRVDRIEAEWEEQQKQAEFERKQKELAEIDKQRTKKKRAKRQKLKAKKKSKRAAEGAGEGAGGEAVRSASESGSADEHIPPVEDVD